MKPLLLKHLSGEPIGRFPVWMMRQAGRYLPSYRKLREKHSFWEMATTPELAAEVSLLPMGEIPVDGIIFFSDILTLPYGMGLPVLMKESIGPVIEAPLRDLPSFQFFAEYEPAKHTPFVSNALNIIKGQIPESMALLGFAGAPWTVASYLIEGKANRHFSSIKYWMHRDPSNLSEALGLLADATLKYLESQSRAGTHMVQLFDTWIGEMPRWFFQQHYLPVLQRIFLGLKAKNIPAIYFTKNSTHLLDLFTELSADGLSVDNLLSLKEVEVKTSAQFFLQGNLDPVLLLKATPLEIRSKTRLLVQEAQTLKVPAIMNLAHGILPETPLENAKAFIEEARHLWV